MVVPASDAPKSGAKSFQCPSCAGQIVLRAAGQSLVAVCGHCSSIIDVENENYKIIQAASAKERTTLIPIGAKASLFDTTWEVIGYTQKSDSTGDYVWSEYLLFNPYAGYRFLVESQGHWNFVEIVKGDLPGVSRSRQQQIFVDSQKYKVFLVDTSRVIYVKGEFYWRIKVGDRTKETDYVAPPYLLSIEESAGEEVLSKGTYVEPRVIQDAFAIGLLRMPRRKGVAANQPSPYQGSMGKIWGVFIASAVLALLVQTVFAGRADKERLYSNSYIYAGSQKGQTFASPVFTISEQSNVMVRTFSPVDNNWTEVEYSLVSDKVSFDGASAAPSQSSAAAAASPGTVWVPCANENSFCSFSGTRRVRYGSGNGLTTGTFSNGTACNSSVFGDPAYGMSKNCWYEDIPSSYAVTSTAGAGNSSLIPAEAKPQRAYETLASVEYYHGRDSDGEWREGGHYSSDYIASAVPSGNYRLLYDIDSGLFAKTGQAEVKVEVIRDVLSAGNFFWTIFLLFIFPVWAGIRHSAFESSRWSQSDFAP